MKRLLLVLIFLVGLLAYAQAQQDFPVSFKNDHPFFSNPSLSALENKSMLLQSGYKSQTNNAFNNIGVKSIYVAAEKNIIENQMAVGFVVLSNTINRTALNDLSILLNYNYQLNLQKNAQGVSTRKLNFGLQAGLREWSFSSENLTFGSQYDPSYLGGYNPGISPSVQLLEYKIVFDANVGANYTHLFQNDMTFSGGFALFHIFRPHTGFTETEGRIALKTIAHASLNVTHFRKLNVLYSAMYLHQNPYQMLEVGAMATIFLDTKTSLRAGLYYRSPSVILPVVGIASQNVSINFSMETYLESSYSNMFNVSLAYYF